MLPVQPAELTKPSGACDFGSRRYYSWRMCLRIGVDGWKDLAQESVQGAGVSASCLCTREKTDIERHSFKLPLLETAIKLEARIHNQVLIGGGFRCRMSRRSFPGINQPTKLAYTNGAPRGRRRQ